MKKIDRKKLSLTLIIVLGLVVSLSIAYAALSTTLTISGSGKVNASDWGVTISNSTNSFVSSSTGSATFTTPVITGTTIANYTVSLTKPGDSVTLYFVLKNEGDINAEISSIISTTPVCTSSTGNTADVSLVCDNLNISLDYYYDRPMAVGNIIAADDSSQICYDENSSGSIMPFFKLSITLDSSMTSVPGSKVTISNLKHEINFIQTEKKCSSSGGIIAPI